ncbi:MAG TPA: YqgE/AlgH family protein [Salinivirgaceae bacterium]|nr:YqgE/AlgH family protein [Salinivirgaceae bacterium]
MKTFDNIFAIKDDPSKVREGVVLISEPFGDDMYFGRSVVLIVEHSKDGTVGFVLNRTISIQLKNLFGEHNKLPDIPDNLSLGGPVEPNTLHFIHTLGPQLGNCKQILPDIYWGGDIEKVLYLKKTGLIDSRQIKFFIGYSGWAPGQLAEEINRSQWLISSISPGKIISSPSNLWEETIREMGEQYRVWLNVPVDARLN